MACQSINIYPNSQTAVPNPTTSQPTADVVNRATAKGLPDALPAIGWACYLGSSWTWIIGMLFPGLLLRDFGAAGYWAFAIPNVLGAAAMGFVLKNAHASAAMVSKHRPMLNLFGEVTISYHVFVIFWLFLRLYGEWFVLLVPPIAAVMFALTNQGPGANGKGSRRVVFLAMVVSFTAAAIFIKTWLDPNQSSQLHITTDAPALSTLDLWLFIPASIAGFLCCPYLDLTFHRARLETSPNGGKLAFGAGFGIVFFSMILFAALYGHLTAPFMGQDHLVDKAPAPLVVESSTQQDLHSKLPMLAAFFMIQICFTLCVHLQERLRGGKLKDCFQSMTAIGIGAGLGIIALTEHIAGEHIYRGYLICYGTLFPLYIWLVTLPRLKRRPVQPAARFKLYVIACLLAYPLAYLGYAHNINWAAIGCILVFGFSRLILELLPTTPGSSPAPGSSPPPEVRLKAHPKSSRKISPDSSPES